MAYWPRYGNNLGLWPRYGNNLGLLATLRELVNKSSPMERSRSFRPERRGENHW
ncbi:MAG: hypothetical protein F6K65_24055 [Moorea sp. SIO3C2]|nr:hypothetical protein [Moorena sp. SIO3C2]